ncbi:MAG: hypothetical protein JWQ40_3777 [Segetibacter sp.]|nr:hypothetical protein [Segetibacter sp.]
MELYSRTGQLYKRLVQTNAEDGFNVFRTPTDAAAPTGNWNCKVKIGGAVFEKKLKIETVMPNRATQLQLSTNKAKLLQEDSKFKKRMEISSYSH